MKGKYLSYLIPIWSLTIVEIVVYILSKAIDHLEGINLLLLLAKMCKLTIKLITNREYKAKFVKAKLKKPKIGACKLIKFITSNCSKGELILKDNNWLEVLLLIFINVGVLAWSEKIKFLMLILDIIRYSIYLNLGY